MKFDLKKTIAGFCVTGVGTVGAVGATVLSSSKSVDVKEEEKQENKLPPAPEKAAAALPGSIATRNSTYSYAANTSGAVFSKYLLSKVGNDEKWTQRAQKMKTSTVKSLLFSSAQDLIKAKKTDQLKAVCEQMYTYTKTQWNNPMPYSKDGNSAAAKVLWEETWEWCSVNGNSDGKPADWPSLALPSS